VPQVSGAAVFVVAAIAAVAVGLGAASIANGGLGEHVGGTPWGRHRVASVLVGLGYFALATLIVFAVVTASR
jgi:hypothetical protein